MRPTSSPKAPSRAFGCIFLLFLGLGLFFVVMITREVIYAAVTYTWPAERCQIMESDVRESSDRLPWFAYLRYQSSAGESVRSSRPFGTYSEAVHFVRRWPAGSSAPCYLDPRDPPGALLERKGENLVLALFLPIPLLFVFIGAMGFYTVVFRPETKLYQPPVGNPIASRRFMAALLLVLGSVLFMAFLLVPVRHALAARSWRSGDCKILRSEVRGYKSSRGSDGYAPEIFYSYLVDGREHRSDTYSFFELSRGWESARHLVDDYRPGSTITCYINPVDPDDATLHRGPSLSWLSVLVPLDLLAGGLKAWPRRSSSSQPLETQ